ncbi:MAG TPA: hypothetical protein VFH40_01605 [Gemmatimonadales bacterium]|nr:hypothetical protein [Gemmatimonadales bacterium]
MNTRRQFLIQSPIGLASFIASCRWPSKNPANSARPAEPTPGTPSA